MISSTSTGAPHASPFRGSLVTGSLSFAIGLALWFAWLAIDTVVFFIQLSRHAHQTGHHFFSLIGSGLGMIVGYDTAFFLGAFFAARPRWSHRPALSSFFAYSVYLAIHLPSIDGSRASTFEIFLILSPLLASPLGGLVGERLFAAKRSWPE